MLSVRAVLQLKRHDSSTLLQSAVKRFLASTANYNVLHEPAILVLAKGATATIAKHPDPQKVDRDWGYPHPVALFLRFSHRKSINVSFTDQKCHEQNLAMNGQRGLHYPWYNNC
jgi:hypothetical protein